MYVKFNTHTYVNAITAHFVTVTARKLKTKHHTVSCYMQMSSASASVSCRAFYQNPSFSNSITYEHKP